MKEYVWYEPINDFIFIVKHVAEFGVYDGMHVKSVGIETTVWCDYPYPFQQGIRCILLGEL